MSIENALNVALGRDVTCQEHTGIVTKPGRSLMSLPRETVLNRPQRVSIEHVR